MGHVGHNANQFRSRWVASGMARWTPLGKEDLEGSINGWFTCGYNNEGSKEYHNLVIGELLAKIVTHRKWKKGGPTVL